MTTYVKISTTNINKDRLTEDLINAGLPLPSILYAGFDSGSRIYTRFTETREIASVTDGTGTTIFTAEPGELRLTYKPSLSTAQQTTLDSVIAAHDPLTLSLEQGREDKDVAVLTQVTNNLRKVNWDSLNNNTRQETIRRALQLLFRDNRFRDLDTDD